MVLSSDKREGETMMQAAESYMGELVHRSMVQVRCENLESSSTKFKSCSLHDHMRDLSLLKAKEEDFFKAIDVQEGNSVHPSMFAYTRQLVVHCQDKYGRKKARSYIFKKPNHQQYRSMILMNGAECGSLKPVLGSHFRLLRVLSLDNVGLNRQTVSGNRFGTSIGRVIGSLIYLRYLSAENSNLMILPWIQNLVLLQILKLEGYHSSAEIPKSIKILGKLAHLRHLYLPNWGYSESETKLKLRLNGLSKLETLENFNTRLCEVKDLVQLTSLRRLRIQCYTQDGEEMIKSLATLALSSTSGHRYWALDFQIRGEELLNTPNMIRQLFWNDKFNLEELSITGKLPAELGELFEQQQHTHIDASMIRITTLRLWNSYLEKDPMPLLEKIPTLRDLFFGTHTYMGKEMVCSAMGFPKLTRLDMWCLTNLEKWSVEEGSMPILSELKISQCYLLEELPEGLKFIYSLQKVELYGMSSKLCDSISKVNGEKGSQLFRLITS